MKKVFFTFALFLTSTFAGEFTVKLDRITFIGICYGTKNLPGPFCGVWECDLFYPSKGPQDRVTYTWNAKKDGKTVALHRDMIIDEVSIVTTKESTIDISDWTNGIYSEERRVEMVKRKTLLDYNKYPPPPAQNQLLPDGLSIQKHLIGYRDGDEVYFVIYQSKEIEQIKKFHRYPLFHTWSRDIDKLYAKP
jgi:hypothetical protein